MTDHTHAVIIPRLHLSLRETRTELERTRRLAARLAQHLDAYVDEMYDGTPVDPRAVGQTLHEARQAGLLDDT